MYEKALKIKPDDQDALQGQEKAGEGFKGKMTIYFDLNSSKIAKEYVYRIHLIGESIRNDPQITTIQIIGHTYDLGSKADNQTLSKKGPRP
jgi:outer membrane protein OmpA-like peptidoglycan-associated protein